MKYIVLAPNRAADVGPLADKLYLRYQEPHRHYHNFTHIENGLAEFEKFFGESTPSKAGIDRDTFFAWAYHDAVYDPKASDNEERSARLFIGDSKALGFDMEEADKIAMAILSTTHSGEPNIVTDMDLAGFGQPWEQFKHNTELIRKEYDFVDEASWRAGRAAVLKQFLARDPLYATPQFAAAYTTKAQENLRRAIIELEAE
jgi:predicted metal-dependent HD superfamily phosphohydrolase